MTETYRSSILIVGHREACTRIADAIYQYYGSDTESWHDELECVRASDIDGDAIHEMASCVVVTNKYFKACIRVHLMFKVTDCEPDLRTYEGLITVIEPVTVDTPRWLICGSCDDLQLRMTIVNTGDKFDVEGHFDGLDCYTETVVDDLKHLRDYTGSDRIAASLASEDTEGMDRILEAIGETMWTHHESIEQTQTTPASLGYKAYEDDVNMEDDDVPKNKEKSNDIKPAGVKKQAEDDMDMCDPFTDDVMDQEMKIFEEIMAFKASSTSLAPEQKKIMADRLFSKLSNLYGEDL